MADDPNATRSADPLVAGDSGSTVAHSGLPPTTDGVTAPSAGPSLPPANSGALPAVPGYEVTREIARGGMGRVLAARERALGREVAIKVLLPGAAAGDAVWRFVTESKITAQLPHPNIPSVHALGALADGSPFLAMKLVAGRTLADQLKRRSSPADDLPHFVQAFEQICQAVGFAHSQGVIHRDLKPANVMVGAFGEVQVMDWGLARQTKAEGATGEAEGATEVSADSAFPVPPSALSTQAGSVMGTPAYMAPEQARGEPVDCRADVFSLGGILCEILTASRPFAGSTVVETIRRAAAGDVAGARAALDACGADAELIALAKRCLNPDRDDRPADGKVVADAVADYRTGVEKRLRTAERERAAAEAKAVEQRKRRRVQLALAGSVVLLLFGAGAFGWWQDRQAAERRAEQSRAESEKQEAALLQRAKDHEAAAENRRALGELVGRCETALRADDADAATAVLTDIDRRANLPGADEFAGRIARCRTDLAMSVRLDRAETFRWTLVNWKFPPMTAVESKWIAAFAAYGIAPATTPPAEVARRLDESLIRDRLLLTLDLWHVSLDTPNLLEILREADPNPARDAIRTAVGDKNFALARKLVDELIRGPVRRDLPTRFAIALGGADALVLPAAQRRAVLLAVWPRSPDSLGVAMTLGKTYPINQSDGAAERVRWFQAAVAIRPQNVSSWQHLGLSLVENRQYREAIAALRETLRVDPRSTNALVNLGIALRATGDLDGAVSAYREALRIDPNSTDPHAYNNLGSALADKRELDGAIACFRDAIGFDPKFASAHGNLGQVLLERREPDAAIASFREAVKLDPTYADAFTGLGKALIQKRDGPGALAAFRESLRCDPRNAETHAAVGNLLWDKGDGEGAIAEFRLAIVCDPNEPGHHNNLGILLRQKGDVNGAVAAYREVIRLDPKNTRTRYNLGIALWAMKDADGAIAAYRELLKIDPNHVNGRTNLGYVLDQTEDLDGAIAEYREVLRIDPNHARAKANLESVLKYKAERDAKVAPPPREVKRP